MSLAATTICVSGSLTSIVSTSSTRTSYLRYHQLYTMSEHPAFTMAGLCSVGGLIGFAKTRSIPSLVAGVGVGALYALAATRIKNGGDYGYEIATGASALLLSSSAPRFRKGPVPMGLTLTSALALAYYGKKVYDFRQ